MNRFHGVAVKVFLGSCVLAVAAAAGAQERGGQSNAQAPHQNLKVLPPDIPQQQLLQTMQGFAQALGVQCGYCHATAPAPEGGGGGRGRGPAAPQFDFPSDEKPAKKAAREMMLVVRDLNTRVPAAVSKNGDATTRVECVTCHRGVAIPKQLAEILSQTAAAKGTPAAIAQYRDLRKQYFGAQAYDFSEGSLIALAQRASAPADAVAWLQLNLDYFPFSSRTYAALGQAQQKLSNRDEALKNLTRASELDPQNAQIKRQLDQLKDAK
ncbi:MAG TPA: c-type cytochrome [Vicinamibacterales bacterium]|nr:c-type cytochrome [Vicinamibacterales bacterium]